MDIEYEFWSRYRYIWLSALILTGLVSALLIWDLFYWYLPAFGLHITPMGHLLLIMLVLAQYLAFRIISMNASPWMRGQREILRCAKTLDYTRELEVINSVMDKYPLDSKFKNIYLMNKVNALTLLGRFDAALVTSERVKLDHFDQSFLSFHYGMMATIYSEMGKYDVARDHINMAMRHRATPIRCFEKAYIMACMGKDNEALKLIKKGMSTKDKPARYGSFISVTGTGKNMRLRIGPQQKYTRVKRMDDINRNFYLGMTYQKLKDRKKAVKYLKKVDSPKELFFYNRTKTALLELKVRG